jgi:hypothetical protein
MGSTRGLNRPSISVDRPAGAKGSSPTNKMRRMRGKLTYANVMATIAVFIALGGASYAAVKLPANSVGADQIKKGAVTPAKLSRASMAALIGPAGPAGARGKEGAPGKEGKEGHTGQEGHPGKEGKAAEAPPGSPTPTRALAWASVGFEGEIIAGEGIQSVEYDQAFEDFCVIADPSVGPAVDTAPVVSPHGALADPAYAIVEPESCGSSPTLAYSYEVNIYVGGTANRTDRPFSIVIP